MLLLVFCVFSLQIGTQLVVEPEQLRAAVLAAPGAPASLYVLPWHTDPTLLHERFVDMPLLEPEDGARLEQCARVMNSIVQRIDHEDPWVLAQFNVRGAGEGIVWYPHSLLATPERGSLLHVDQFAAFTFKTKGSSHQMVAAPVCIHNHLFFNVHFCFLIHT